MTQLYLNGIIAENKDADEDGKEFTVYREPMDGANRQRNSNCLSLPSRWLERNSIRAFRNCCVKAKESFLSPKRQSSDCNLSGTASVYHPSQSQAFEAVFLYIFLSIRRISC